MDVLVIGQMPPPVHGQAIATKAMVDLLKSNDVSLDVRDIARPVGALGGIQKILRHLKAAVAIAVTEARNVYLTVNDRYGMFLTVFLALTARLSGKQLLLHHHSSRYLTTSSLVARWLIRAAGPHAVHIHQSPGLCEHLRAQYPGVRRLLPFSNVGILPLMVPGPVRSGPLRLGHMSNLSQAKGIGEAIESLRAVGGDCELVVAGPCSDAYAVAEIRSAEQEFGSRFRYLGPVYGDDKAKFFSEIDIFLFPSRYAAETQGIVNLEALANGKPVVAFDLGCIGRDLGGSGGVLVNQSKSFSDAVAGYVPRYLQDREAASSAARNRYQWLREEHASEERDMLAFFGAAQGAGADSRLLSST